MNWYEIHGFKDRLAAIEQFFVEIAANEEQLLTYGFKRAFSLPGAEDALEALKTFIVKSILVKDHRCACHSCSNH